MFAHASLDRTHPYRKNRSIKEIRKILALETDFEHIFIRKNILPRYTAGFPCIVYQEKHIFYSVIFIGCASSNTLKSSYRAG